MQQRWRWLNQQPRCWGGEWLKDLIYFRTIKDIFGQLQQGDVDKQHFSFFWSICHCSELFCAVSSDGKDRGTIIPWSCSLLLGLRWKSTNRYGRAVPLVEARWNYMNSVEANSHSLPIFLGLYPSSTSGDCTVWSFSGSLALGMPRHGFVWKAKNSVNCGAGIQNLFSTQSIHAYGYSMHIESWIVFK